MNEIARIQPPNAPTKDDLAIVAYYHKRYETSFRTFALSDIAEVDREPLHKALMACMVKPTERQMAEVIATISASWPHGYQHVAAVTLDLYLRLLAEDLAEFPPDALFAGIRDLRRESKFMPSIAELRKAVNEHFWTRGWLIGIIEGLPPGRRIKPPGAL